MRGKKAMINSIMGLVEELAAIISGFILPRMILGAYGSTYNGLISSITQFLSAAVLLRCGIGGATRAALYRPLADHDTKKINEIVKATDIFMKKIGLLLLSLIFILAATYPFLVSNEFGWLFTFTLILIIGASTFAESFFGITYMILLQADQQIWISSLFRSICYLLNVIVTYILIKQGLPIHFVKAGSAAVYVLYPIIIGIVIKLKYRLNLKSFQPDNKAISQRWDAFWHQFSLFIMDNTDVIVLTIFSNMREVSVYTIYIMVLSGIKRAIMAFTNGLEAAFGNMIAKKENGQLKKSYSTVETLILNMSTVIYACTFVLLVDFVLIYTNNVFDVDYSRPVFAGMMIVAQFFLCIQLPSILVVQAAGHYKQTKRMAAAEPIINIISSIILVGRFGLIGVAIGTLIASVYKTVVFDTYADKNILNRNVYSFVRKVLVSGIEIIVVIFAFRIFRFEPPNNYLVWIWHAVIAFLLAIVITILGDLVVARDDLNDLINRVHLTIKKT